MWEKGLKSKYKKVLRRIARVVEFFETFYYLILCLFLVLSISLVISKWPPIYLIIILTLLTVFLLGVLLQRELRKRQKLILRRQWQALGWTHYYQILSETLIKSVDDLGKMRFRFTTFYNGQFEHKLKSGFYSELQYIRGSKPEIDIVIFDIEYLNLLRNGISFLGKGPLYKLVPYERFLDKDKLPYLPISEFKQVLQPAENTTYAFPFRWGLNGITVKLDSGSIGILERKGVILNENTPFDIRYLTDEESEFHKWLKDSTESCWIVALDWYLPTMMLFAWDLWPQGCHQLHNSEFQKVIGNLEKLKPLMHPTEPFIEDPLRLAQKLRDEKNLIVLGGGNWLSIVGEKLPSNVMFLPTQNGFILWCECLGFLAPDAVNIEGDWAVDASNLVDWFLKRRDDIMSASSFEAYSPDNIEQYEKVRTSSNELIVRQLPPFTDDDNYISVKRWQEEWDKWKAQVLSRRT